MYWLLMWVVKDKKVLLEAFSKGTSNQEEVRKYS